MLDTRRYLESGTILHLCRENSHHTDDWEILERIGEGGSSVCYTAVSSRKMGRLKEFNPVSAAVDAGSMTGFLAAYRTLEDVKAKNTRYQVLNNYIPHYELLFSVDDDGRYTGAYVWTPDDKTGTNFADYLREVRKNPENRPEQAIANILDIVYTLTDCVCLLHSAGILHLDLKPSNFLVTYNSRMELNTGNISLFDINTITSIDGDVSMAVGTDGYCAPEVDMGAPDNRSDIYSIGAILFNALVIDDTIPGGIWRGEYYDRLEGLISESKLIRATGTNISRKLCEKLADILRKCLAYIPNERYDYCELLMEDLLEARQLVEYRQPAGSERQAAPDDNMQEISVAGSDRKPVRSVRRWAGIAVALCIVAVAALGLNKWRNINAYGTKEPDVTAAENATKIEASVGSKVSANQPLEEITESEQIIELEQIKTASGEVTESEDAENDTVTETDAIDIISDEYLTERLIAQFEDAYYEGGETEFTLDSETLGTDRLALSEAVVLYPRQKLTVPAEATIVCGDWNTLISDSGSEIVVESSDSLIRTSHLDDGVLVVLKNRGQLTIDGITFYACGGDGWAEAGDNFMYLSTMTEGGTGKRFLVVTVVGDVYVSCDYDTFLEKGYRYFFEEETQPLAEDDKLLRRAIFFAGSDEPYEEIRREECDWETINAEKTLRKVTDTLEQEYKHGFKRDFTLDYEMMGTDRLILTGPLVAWASEKLVIPKETSIICRDGYMVHLMENSEADVESAYSLLQPEGEPTLVMVMQSNSILTIEDISFYAVGSLNTIYITSAIDELTGRQIITFNVIGEMYVSCDYDTFAEKGFRYCFGYDGEPNWADVCHMDCLAIFFDGSDEPYDVLFKEDFTA